MRYFIIIISLLLSLATSAQASDPVKIIEETINHSVDSVTVNNSVYITNYDFGENTYTVYYYHYYQGKDGKVKRAVLGRSTVTLAHYQETRIPIPDNTNHILVTSTKKGREYNGAYKKNKAIVDS